VLKTKQELLQTSAQDQFAKWAKLRRSVDKGLADLEKMSSWLLYFLVFSVSLRPAGSFVAYRFRDRDYPHRIFAQVQFGALGTDNWPAILHWLVVS
jgi:hypothetical protein